MVAPLVLAALALAADALPPVALVKATGGPAVVKELQAHVEPLQGCYDLALRYAPALKGTLTVTFELDPEAGLTTIKATPDSLKDETLVPCSLARLRAGEWPAVKKATTVTATYRFGR